MNRKRIVIRANKMFDGKRWQKDKSIVVEDDKIVDILPSGCYANYDGIVTPAFIDPHSHIGLFRDGEPAQEQEGNDYLRHIQPTLNPLYSLNMEDKAFSAAVDFGVLYSCIVPGSSNLIGGKAIIIRNFVDDTDDAVVKDYGYKLALGYNPRNAEGKQGKRPKTRMGIYALLEDVFDELIRKKERLENEFALEQLKYKSKQFPVSMTAKYKEILKKKFNLKFSNEEKALLEILTKEKTVKIHVHQENDVNYLIRLVKKYNLNATAEHLGDIHHVKYFNKLAENNIPIVYGPLDVIGKKSELKNKHYSNVKLLMESRAFFGLMTDHPIIHTMNIKDCLKYFLFFGMSEEDALSIITYRNAKILGLEDTLGTIEPGKLASLIVWDKDPMRLGAKPIMVMGEGKVLRENHIK